MPIKPFKQYLQEMPYFLHHMDKEQHRHDDHPIHVANRNNDKLTHWFTHPKTGHHIRAGKIDDEEGTTHTMFRAIDPNTNKTHIQVHGHMDYKKNTFTVHGVYGHKHSTIKAHQMYHGMLRHGKLGKIISDNQQSMGGAKTWAHLSQYNDLKVKHKSNFYGVKYRKRLHPAHKGKFGDNFTGPSRFEATPIKSKLHYAVRLLRKKRYPIDALKK